MLPTQDLPIQEQRIWSFRAQFPVLGLKAGNKMLKMEKQRQKNMDTRVGHNVLENNEEMSGRGGGKKKHAQANGKKQVEAILRI